MLEALATMAASPMEATANGPKTGYPTKNPTTNAGPKANGVLDHSGLRGPDSLKKAKANWLLPAFLRPPHQGPQKSAANRANPWRIALT